MPHTPQFTFRNLHSTDGLKTHTEDKLKKLDKYIERPTSLHITFNVEKLDHIVEINLHANGSKYIVTERSPDMYSSIDGAVAKLQTQLSRDHERNKHHHS